tara:strand:- start:388 stop:1290 length:903 start_codon:yes stop_codon:yes gene_type:complete
MGIAVHKLLLCFFAFFALHAIHAQEINRSFLSVMVIPYSRTGEDVLTRYEEDIHYRAAVAEINNALINRGYTFTQDLRTQKALVEKVRKYNLDGNQRDALKELIEELPADIIIEAEIIWTDPEGHPEDREVQLILNAIDKHTASLYASSPSIKSYQRAFNNIQEAVSIALQRDGKTAFDAFILQMESTLKKGRQLPFRFELSATSPINYLDTVNSIRVQELVHEALKKYALGGYSRVSGESKTFIQGFSLEPVIDNNGYYVQPCGSLCQGVEQFLLEKGLVIHYQRAGQQVFFQLEGLNR